MSGENMTVQEQLTATAMEIIMNAGDARLSVTNALKAVVRQDFEVVAEHLKEAQEYLKVAHGLQTDTIQSEGNGEVIGHSLMFAHAQDTLMTIYSELNMTRQLVQIFESYEARIKALEAMR